MLLFLFFTYSFLKDFYFYFQIYRNIFKEHLSRVERLDDLHLCKCEETGCSLCQEPEQVANFLMSSNETLNENQQTAAQSLSEAENCLSKFIESQNKCQQVSNKNKLKIKRASLASASTSVDPSEKPMESSSLNQPSKNKNSREKIALLTPKPLLTSSEISAESQSEKPSSSNISFLFHNINNSSCKRMFPLPIPESNSRLVKPYIGENIVTVETPKRICKLVLS